MYVIKHPAYMHLTSTQTETSKDTKTTDLRQMRIAINEAAAL